MKNVFLRCAHIPQSRISAVEISICSPIDSNTCIEVTSGALAVNKCMGGHD
jgi:hypothetical protein